MFLKDLFSLAHFSVAAMQEVMERARYFKDRDRNQTFKSLQGKNVAISFWEPSTRTRLSFALAVQKLGGTVIDYQPEMGSEKKGESIEDTVKTMLSLGAAALIFRSSIPGLFYEIAPHVELSFISGGEGCYQHPTQALLDIFTLQQRGVTLQGANVVMVGDILHSRVARSHFYALPAFGASLTLVAPPVFLPDALVPPGASAGFSLEEALPAADILYLLRVQKERQGVNLLPSLNAYASLYGLDQKRLALLKKDALLLHPGPMNVGTEISYEALKYLERHNPERVLFQEQVANGVYTRMAVLDLLLAGR
ncbi:MAG: aspartate carbamoyltransferase catalytic subunit [Bacillota bacterium]